MTALEKKPKRTFKQEENEQAEKMRQCPECYFTFTYEGRNVCPHCGYVFPKQERELEVSRVRIAATVINWANDATTTVADINSIITILRAERDRKSVQPEPEPEPNGDEGTEGE